VKREFLRIITVVSIGLLLLTAVHVLLPPFGEFPVFRENVVVGQRILEEAPLRTGATNVVTSVVWGYRGYDTFGEATVLFTAVVGVVALLRPRREKT
jgi:multisubunit Na+/H+ antiporter MnhB subunit